MTKTSGACHVRRGGRPHSGTRPNLYECFLTFAVARVSRLLEHRVCALDQRQGALWSSRRWPRSPDTETWPAVRDVAGDAMGDFDRRASRRCAMPMSTAMPNWVTLSARRISALH